jgi:flagellar biosynthesis/type III secretory pathway protein FliH
MSDKHEYLLAEEILALADENPSEPFSLERKWLIEKIELAIYSYSQRIDNERDSAYDLGFDDGHKEATIDAEDRIAELEEEIERLEDELNLSQEALDNVFAEGFEAGHQDNSHVESIELS